MQKEETKPVLSVKSFFHSTVFIRHAVFLLIALLALAVRLPQLGVRPMHTDEAVNAFILGKVLAGEKYHYDPQDRHGPALAELTLPLVRLAGAEKFSDLTESELRLSPVLVGSAMILLFGAAAEMFGFIPCLVAALLFAFTPMPVYYSRYFIHETLFVLATFGLILSGWRALQKNSLGFAALAGLWAALMLACKETAGLHFFALGLAAVIAWRLRAPGKIPPAKTWLAGVSTFLAAGILLFTWGGENWSALADLFRAIPQLAARAGGEGHQKPFSYYFILLAGGGSGAVILVFSLLGLFRAHRSFARLTLAVYAILIVAIYDAIPYKTPWLALNFWLPLALLAGFAVECFWTACGKFYFRAAILAGCAALALLVAHDTRQRVFLNPAGENNPYAYAHTTEDLLGLPVRLAELVRHSKLPNPRIAVVAHDAWPLPWYLRKYAQVGYWQPGRETGAADFFITTTDVTGPLAKNLNDHFRPEFFGVRPNVLLVLWSPVVAPPSQPTP